LEAKKKANDDARLQTERDLRLRNSSETLIETEISVAEKNTAEIELEAENLSLRNTFHQQQLNIKDEDLILEIRQDKDEITKIDNSIKNKTKIRDAIEAGTNCTKRNS
jgi:acetolactate synthase small subunit